MPKGPAPARSSSSRPPSGPITRGRKSEKKVLSSSSGSDNERTQSSSPKQGKKPSNKCTKTVTEDDMDVVDLDWKTSADGTITYSVATPTPIPTTSSPIEPTSPHSAAASSSLSPIGASNLPNQEKTAESVPDDPIISSTEKGKRPEIAAPEDTNMDVDPSAVSPNKEASTTRTTQSDVDEEALAASIQIEKTRCMAWVPLESFTPLKKSTSQLRNEITSLFSNVPGFLNLRVGTNKEQKGHLVATFNNRKGLTEVLDKPLETYNNATFTEYIPKRITSPEKDRQLIVRNIPLFLRKAAIENYFKHVGTVESCSLRTSGLFMIATVTFDTPDAIVDYQKDLWCGYINGHAVLIHPANISNDEWNLRSQHIAILSGFPINICALDLVAIVQDLQIKSMHIPRTDYKYFQRPWAFVAFESETHMQIAMERTVSFGRKSLSWSTIEKRAELCKHCGSPNHQLKDCDQRKQPNNNRRMVSDSLKSLYDRYLPAGHTRASSRSRSRSRLRKPPTTTTPPSTSTKRPTVSYADSVSGGTEKGGSMHDNNSSSSSTGASHQQPPRPRNRSSSNKSSHNDFSGPSNSFKDSSADGGYAKHINDKLTEILNQLCAMNDTITQLTNRVDGVEREAINIHYRLQVMEVHNGIETSDYKLTDAQKTALNITTNPLLHPSSMQGLQDQSGASDPHDITEWGAQERCLAERDDEIASLTTHVSSLLTANAKAVSDNQILQKNLRAVVSEKQQLMVTATDLNSQLSLLRSQHNALAQQVAAITPQLQGSGSSSSDSKQSGW